MSHRGDPVYDSIGAGYSEQRQPDPRWAALISAALGDAETIVNVGAGTGNYEPADRHVVAVEPSPRMIAQRSPGPALQGLAEALPLRSGSFDAALATFTLHHWADLNSGLEEIKRVARRQVIVLCEPLTSIDFWLNDYFPEMADIGANVDAPGVDGVEQVLAVESVEIMWIPHDLSDGVAAAYWRRPEAYLDPAVQASMSVLALLTPEARGRGTDHLRRDLETGEWHRRHGHLLDQESADFGYRIVTAG